jgi:hypothetical protein
MNKMNYDITRLPGDELALLRIRSARMMKLCHVFNRLTVATLGLALLACVGFFVITLWGYAHQVWMFSLSFALIACAVISKGIETFYWHKYRAVRDDLAADVINWLAKLKHIDKEA